MSKPRYAVVIGAILALAATAFAQSPTTQPGMSAQQAQPTMPGQQPPVAGQQPAAPGQPPQAERNQNAPATGASPADDAAKQLAQVVNLSDAQTAQVRDIFQDEHSQLTALQNDRALSSEEQQTKLMGIRRAASDKVMAVLTPDQQQKLKDAVQKRHQQNQPSTPQPAQKPPQ